MNLYLLTRTDKVSYDDYDSAVVAAPSKKAALLTHPNSQFYQYGKDGKVYNTHDRSVAGYGRWYGYDSWVGEKLENIEVTLLGKAKKGLKSGVVLASFNAG